MSAAQPPPTTRLRFVMFIPYVLMASVLILFVGRYVFRIGNPYQPPAQGAVLASMRGFRFLEVSYLLANGDQDTIGVNENGHVGHYLYTTAGDYSRTSTGTLDSALLQQLKDVQTAWCTQPPTLPTAIDPSLVQLQVNCTPSTSRYFYIPVAQVPRALDALVSAAPPLAAPKATSTPR